MTPDSRKRSRTSLWGAGWACAYIALYQLIALYRWWGWFAPAFVYLLALGGHLSVAWSVRRYRRRTDGRTATADDGRPIWLRVRDQPGTGLVLFESDLGTADQVSMFASGERYVSGARGREACVVLDIDMARRVSEALATFVESRR